MKILDIPKSGRCGNMVAYPGRYGQCQRQLVVPRNASTAARDQMRGAFGRFARAWGGLLTQAQRERWNLAGPQVLSHPRLGQSGPLTGQQHFQGINSARACIGLGPLWEPPERVVFGVNPVGELVIENGADGVRLLLRVAEEWARGDTRRPGEEVMVFGQGPCSAGRSKRRNVSYLGLLPAAVGGLSDITELYVAKYGEPRAGTKVFIVTRQQKDGWEGEDKEASEVVRGTPERQQAAGGAALTLKDHMHKGCTRDAEGSNTVPPPGCQEGEKAATGGSPKAEGQGTKEMGESEGRTGGGLG